MATTSKHKLRYPVGSDSAAALATYFANLANDVDNKLEQAGAPYYGKNYVQSGAALSNPSGHNVAVALGRANINGATFDFAASGNLAMTPSTTNRIWLTGVFDGNGFLTGYTWAVRTDAVVPANSVLVGEVVEGAAAPTTMTPTYRGIIAPGAVISSALATVDSGGAGDKMSVQVVHDGVTNVELFMSVHIGSTGGFPRMDLRDAAAGGGNVLKKLEGPTTVALSMSGGPSPLPPALGAKTYFANLQNTAGTPTLYAAAYGGTYGGAMLIAKWSL